MGRLGVPQQHIDPEGLQLVGHIDRFREDAVGEGGGEEVAVVPAGQQQPLADSPGGAGAGIRSGGGSCLAGAWIWAVRAGAWVCVRACGGGRCGVHVGESGGEGHLEPVPVPAGPTNGAVGGQLRLTAGECLEIVRPVRPQQGRFDPGHGGQSLVRPLCDELLGQPPKDIERVVQERRIVQDPPGRRTGTGQHLHPVEAAQQPVAFVARLGARHHGRHDLAQVGVVLPGLHRGGAGVLGVLARPVVVTDVVTEDRDDGRLEIGADHEQLVLQDPRSFGVHDAVLAQEGGAEHLVRGEAVDQRGVPDGALLPGPAHQAVRHTAAAEIAGDLPDHHIGAVARPHGVQPLQCLRGHPVVMIDELHIGAVRVLHPDIAGFAGPARVGDADQPEVVVLGGQRRRSGPGCRRSSRRPRTGPRTRAGAVSAAASSRSGAGGGCPSCMSGPPQ